LPHLETLHYGFKFQASSGKGYYFCAHAKCLSPWRKKHHIDNDYSVCPARKFHGQGLLQHCRDKGDDYHEAAAFYLTKLFKIGMGLTQADLHHGTNDQLRIKNTTLPSVVCKNLHLHKTHRDHHLSKLLP
jgi:hypothetical protein